MKAKRLDITEDQINKLLDRVKSKELAEGDAELIEAMADSLKFLYTALENKNTSLERLRRMLFGETSEKTRKVFQRLLREKTKAPQDKPKGHGRNGAAAYTGAERVRVKHATLKPGDHCPSCKQGKVYERNEPGQLVRFIAKAPLMAKVTELQKLRCSSCQEVFTADPPKDVGPKKYDESCVSMIACLKYGAGMPFNRIEAFQGEMGVPFPASTQWELIAPAADSIYPIYEALTYEAAQGDVVHNDDTSATILALMKEKDKHELDASNIKRKAVHTSGVVSKVNGRDIALFFTGPKVSGENLATVLKERAAELGPPIHMCDPLSHNTPKDFEVILANCMAHARRRFVEVAGTFPDESLHVLESLRKVYRHDHLSKNLTPDERLVYHQTHSQEIMDELHTWMKTQLAEKQVEPNSGLGTSINYMLKRWDALTLFLKKAGAPLDNNIVERALKKAILHRKNALFFRTERGAKVADIFMSLIHTCCLNDVNAFEYLTTLQRHIPQVVQNPASWLPWNYTETLKGIDTS